MLGNLLKGGLGAVPMIAEALGFGDDERQQILGAIKWVVDRVEEIDARSKDQSAALARLERMLLAERV